MKYVLVNKFDEIISKVDLPETDGRVGAHTYFKGVKQMPDDKEFDKLWRVMTEEVYNSTFQNNLQNRQMKDLTKEQKMELEVLAAEMEAEAIQMKLDYENNPSEESGSVVVVHENSDFLDESKSSSQVLAEWEPDPLDLPDIDEEE